MRPKLFALCAVSSLLMAATQWACAQSGPLISSGRAAPGASSSSSSAALNAAPASAPIPTPGAFAGSPLRDQSLQSDQSWTRSSPEVSLAQFTSSDPAPTAQPTSLPTALPTSLPTSLGTANRAEAGSGATGRPKSSGNTDNAAAASQEPRALKPPTGAGSATQGKRSSGTVQMFISVASSLLIVIGLVLGAAWCYRKASPNSTSSLPKQVVQVLGRTPLAPRQQLILVRFGSKLVLVSNLQGEVRTISEIADPLEVDRVAGMCESSQAGSISDSFRTVLHNIGRTG